MATLFFYDCDIVASETRNIFSGGNDHEKEFNRNRIYFRQKRINEWVRSRHDRRI